MSLKKHDDYFKFVFSIKDNVKTFIEEFFPDIAKHVDLDSIEPQATEKNLVEDKQKQFLDFAVNCRIKNKPSKLYFIFEHKSFPDKRIFVQIIRYILSVWEEDIANKRSLTPVISIVFYNGKRSWKLPKSTILFFKNFPEDIKRYFLSLEYLLFDTNDISSIDIKKRLSKNQIFMVALDIIKEVGKKNKDKEVIRKLFKELAMLLKEHKEEYDESISIFIEMSIYYIQYGLKIPENEIIDIFENKEDEDMRSVVDIIKEKGKEEGILEGIQKGKEEGILEGMLRGREEGELKAKKTTIINLRKTMKLAPEDIANIVELPVDRVKEILKDEGLMQDI